MQESASLQSGLPGEGRNLFLKEGLFNTLLLWSPWKWQRDPNKKSASLGKGGPTHRWELPTLRVSATSYFISTSCHYTGTPSRWGQWLGKWAVTPLSPEQTNGDGLRTGFRVSGLEDASEIIRDPGEMWLAQDHTLSCIDEDESPFHTSTQWLLTRLRGTYHCPLFTDKVMSLTGPEYASQGHEAAK